MFRFEADLKVFLHREPVDFRAGINSLVALVEQSMQLDPFARAVFAFHNRRRKRVKLLFYSLMLTCRACNVEPYAYLLRVLTELPQRPPGTDITDLLSFNLATRPAATGTSG
ncbi:IS66 family insertion sequence element accessory protein TnpB [Paraburkholderia sp. GAS42]|uniref:IS66 family insertion sequence element accessory protein TnpB n=1 Tax=Paraburkholderia sp. GAS42 TaxID=3035135 RepID=UPI003D20BB90